MAIESRLEASVLHRAAAVTAVSEGFSLKLQRLAPQADRSKFHVIRNSFDPGSGAPAPRNPPKRFTIAYTGRFYGDQISARPLFEALRQLLASTTLQRDEIAIRVMGASRPETIQAATDSGIQDLVSARGPSPHQEALQAQRDATLLFLPMVEGSEASGIIPAKLYEYLFAKRPILALADPSSEVGTIISSVSAGVTIHPGDLDHIVRQISSWLEEFRRHGDVRWNGDHEALDQYSREHRGREMASLLDSLTR